MPSTKRARTSDDGARALSEYDKLLQKPPSDTELAAFTAKNPFLVIDTSMPFPQVQPGGMMCTVLLHIWRKVFMPRLAAVQMTWSLAGEWAVRPYLVGLFEAVRSLCLNVPDVPEDTSTPAPNGGSGAAQPDGQLGLETWLGDSKPGEDMERAASAAAAAAADQDEQADVENRCISADTDDSPTAKHEDGGIMLSKQQTADVVAYKLYSRIISSGSISSSGANASSSGPSSAEAGDRSNQKQQGDAAHATGFPRKIIRLIAEGKASIFGSGGEAWKTQGTYQLLNSMSCAALQNWKRGYLGTVWGMGTDLEHFGLCMVEPKGLLKIDDTGAVVSFLDHPTGQQQQQQVDTSKLLQEALSRVQQLDNCRDVKQLKAGEYLVGTFSFTRVLPFFKLPFNYVYPAPASAYHVSKEVLAVIQWLLLICAGQQASTWTAAEVDVRIKLWEKRLQDASELGKSPLSDDDEWRHAKMYIVPDSMDF